MTTLPSVALTALFLIAVGNAHPQYPVVYYSNGQPYGGGYYGLQQGYPGGGNNVQRYASPVPVRTQDPGQYVYVSPHGYPGLIPQQAPILFRQDVPVVEAPVGEAPDAPPPAGPGVWTMFIQWIGIRPSAPPVVAPEEGQPEAPVQPAPSPAAAAEDTTVPPVQKGPEKPEKVMEATNENKLNEKETGHIENLDETVPEEGGESPNVEYDDDDPKSSVPKVAPPPTFFAVGPVGVQPGRQYVPVNQPQFYGNFDAFHQGKLPLSPVQDAREANFVYLRKQPELKSRYPPVQYPYQPQPFPIVPPRSRSPHPHPAAPYRPGAAAMSFQRTLQAAEQEQQQLRDAHRDGVVVGEGRGALIPGSKYVDISQLVQKQATKLELQGDKHEPAHFPGEQELLGGQSGLTPAGPAVQYTRDGSQPGLINVGPGYQNLYFFTSRGEDNQAISVEASKIKKEMVVSDAENVTVVEEQAGPSVAQAKPQAIAVAGPGGVAAAQPIATAIVGPGGLAVAAPTATAVAGQTGGGTITAPAIAAVNKHLAAGKRGQDDDDYRQSVLAFGV